MQPMSAGRIAVRKVNHVIIASAIVLSLGCRTDAPDNGDDSGAAFTATTDTASATVVPCGRAQTTKCKGALPDDWRTSITGEAWSVMIERWQHELGFGRPQMRRKQNSNPARFTAFTTIYPLDDAHTVAPDKIGGPTVFAILYPAGPDIEHKFGLDPSNFSRYVAILDPSGDPDKGTWRLERVFWDGNSWEHSAVAGSGRWRTCPQNHPPKDYAYADFLRCDQQMSLPPEVMSFGSTTKGTTSTSLLLALPTAMNTLTRNGDEPIWIFCPAGCCEAEW